jgi:TRAP-type uncharacterized transport system substrate-binding protein
MSRTTFVVLLVLALLWLAAGSVGRALPPRQVVIQAGPQGGSFDQHAQAYARVLREAGLAVQVQNIADTLTIVGNLQAGRPRVDLGFTAQAVDARAAPDVRSAGVVELQPLFLFHRAERGTPVSPQDLRGLRLVMPPPASATAKAALDVLALYAVTPENTRVTHLPIQEAVAALRRGEHDAGFFMLAPGNPMITTLALDPALRPFSFEESPALARRLGTLQPAMLPRGAHDLSTLRPAQDLTMVAAPVNVVVREDIHPVVLYALLQAMQETHGGPTLVSNPGDYPTLVGTALPPHPRASEWARSGTPWLYKHLHPVLASMVDTYWAPVLALLALVSAVGTLRSLNELVHRCALWLLLWGLRGVQWRLARGRAPGRASRAMFAAAEQLLADDSAPGHARQTLERLRPHLQGPPACG